ncbi:MAG: aminotransferase class III-fold pyridoxal phosphate-dependent enzyme, partial [Cyanobacteriota bacterium]
GSYHGDTFGAMALGERSLFSAPFEPLLFAVARAPWPATWWGDPTVEQREAEALARLDALLETPTAAVIFEPLLQGASGMRQVRPQFLREVERRVRQAGALLIADEVMTGFGRTGALFASGQAGIAPDLMALSKGLTGGFLPMGATMASERLFAGFVGDDPALTLFHGHSFTANPLGCAAALASLNLLEQQPERYRGFEDRHRPLLQQLAQDSRVHKPRLLGSIAAFDLVSAKVQAAEGYLNPIGRQLQRRVLASGVFLRPLGQVVYLLPPLCISDAELQRCYASLASALQDL